jgi:class 3 adenylate cyclase
MNTRGGDRAERRMAEILAADVVGYSRLMGQDEEGTLAVLKARRAEVIDLAHMLEGLGKAGWTG